MRHDDEDFQPKKKPCETSRPGHFNVELFQVVQMHVDSFEQDLHLVVFDDTDDCRDPQPSGMDTVGQGKSRDFCWISNLPAMQVTTELMIFRTSMRVSSGLTSR